MTPKSPLITPSAAPVVSVERVEVTKPAIANHDLHDPVVIDVAHPHGLDLIVEDESPLLELEVGVVGRDGAREVRGHDLVASIAVDVGRPHQAAEAALQEPFHVVRHPIDHVPVVRHDLQGRVVVQLAHVTPNVPEANTSPRQRG